MASLVHPEDDRAESDIVILLVLTAPAGGREQLRDVLTSQLPDTRSFSGCVEVSALTAHDDENTFVIHERWTSAEDYDRYVAWRRERGDLRQLMKALGGPPTVRRFSIVDTEEP
jgi:quinol monooxygenase YgiN